MCLARLSIVLVEICCDTRPADTDSSKTLFEDLLFAAGSAVLLRLKYFAVKNLSACTYTYFYVDYCTNNDYQVL
jgi:hypothetical protein